MRDPRADAPEPDQLLLRISELEGELARDRAEPSFRDIADCMFEGVQILDRDLRYVYLNPAAARHSRRDRRDLVGRRMTEVYPGIEETEVYALLRRCLDEQAPQQLVNEFTFPDGEAGSFDLRLEPVPDGALILSVDVTEHRAQAERLRASREELATLLECLGEAVIATDDAGCVSRLNRAAEELIGRSRDAARGRPLSGLVDLLDAATRDPLPHLSADPERAAKPGRISNAILVRADGTEAPVEGSVSLVVDASSDRRGVVAVLRDVSDEKRLNEMLQRSQRMEAIARLAAGIAHDFNNLITVISAYSSMALDELPAGHRLRKDLEQILEASQRAASLTRQLLSIGSRQALTLETLDVNSVVERMASMLHRVLGEDVDLVAELDKGPQLVSFDPGQIEQIILNLAVNARDAMPDGGKLTVETTSVELDEEYVEEHPSARRGPHVMIAVTDTGTGMDAATQARIFEPFFTTKEVGRGTGLGLSVIYGIVEQSGGNIWVYSEPGHGTTFKIYLPAAAGRSPRVEGAVKRPEAATTTNGTETILLVEDENSVRALFEKVLGRAGYTVLAAPTAEEALRHCREHDGTIDLLLTDLVLPDGGGGPLAETVAEARPGIRVAYMSGYTPQSIAHRGALAPGAALIGKPILPRQLLETLRGLLD